MASDPTDYQYLKPVKGQMIPGGTKKVGYFYPEELTLIRDKKHFLYDPRVENEFDENIVKGIMLIGLSKSIDAQRMVMEDGQVVLAVTDGRQGVINTIEANRRLVEDGKPALKIKVEVRDEEETTALFRMVATNNHRVDDDPVVKGFKAKRMKDRGVPIDQICIAFKCVPETLGNWIKLTDLCVHVQKLVQTEKLAMTAALKLKNLSPAEQKIKADEIVSGIKKSERGVGSKHVGVDRRKIKRLHELSGAKSDIAKRILDWLVGGNDESVSDLIDFSVLSKKGDDGSGGSGEGNTEKKKKQGREKKDRATEQEETLSRIFGGAKLRTGEELGDPVEDIEDADIGDIDEIMDEELGDLADDDGLDDADTDG